MLRTHPQLPPSRKCSSSPPSWVLVLSLSPSEPAQAEESLPAVPAPGENIQDGYCQEQGGRAALYPADQYRKD